MNKARLLPSDLEEVDDILLYGTRDVSNQRIRSMSAEIRACWDELELLRPIALAAAERMASHPEDETALAEAVAAWQKANRENPNRSDEQKG
jgi:hypothetical protein